MDLEVVGRHALLFDDDNSASFVNSPAALVEWNSLSIDRYDVRHLLSALPPRVKHHQLSPPRHPDSPAEWELDLERYLDLPSTSLEHEQDFDNGARPLNDGGLHAVPFSYGNTNESTEQRNADAESGFRPPFSLPESLLQNLPPSEKVHQIIARTAMFVSKHGGQSEIVLRVKLGDNPTFGFLMPDHHLHVYFRFLVDHSELLSEENKTDSELGQTSIVGGGGALSLLGSVYGSGEDEDGENEDPAELKRNESGEAVGAVDVTISNGSQQTEPSVNLAVKDETVSKHSLASLKEKAPLIKKNQPISTLKGRTSSGMKKDDDALGSLGLAADKAESSALPRMSKVDLHVLEPPSDMKRAVEKIVEFILRNGKEFEAVLVEKDRNYGRFPFLLQSNLYYPYYLKVLREVEESKLPGKCFASEKHDSTTLGLDKKNTRSRDSDVMYLESDIPNNSDRKEKFKMTIGKSKKDASDLPSKAAELNNVVTVDAAAAAAILQAATRGIRNPNLEYLTKMSVAGTSQGPSCEGGRASSFGSLLSSRPQCSKQELDQKGKPSVSIPVTSAIAKSVAVAAASDADSSEAGLTREQKLKAERLKRAKMFAAIMKSKAEPLKSEPRCISVEPPESGFSGSGAEVVNLLGKERERSSVPSGFDTSDKNERSEKKDLGVDLERRSKRKYRSRSTRNEGEEEEIKDQKHSKKPHRSHRSSHHSRDRKRHSSSKDQDSQHCHKHDSSSDNQHRHSRRRRKHDRSSEDEHSRSRHRREHDSSSDAEHRHRRISRKHRKRSHSEREVELEEGEIKSDQSKASEADTVSREASVDVSKSHRSREASVDLSNSWQDGRASSQPCKTNEVSDDLRAKIRAMLMATL